MLWVLYRGCCWICVALLVNLVLSPPNGLCCLAYLVATGVGHWLTALQRCFPWAALCCGGGAVRPSERADPPVPAVAAAEGGGWLSTLASWFGGEAAPEEVAVELA
jgi:hypothetical protein